jgi:hypothetical protein
MTSFAASGFQSIERFGSCNRGVLVPVGSLDAYKDLIRRKLAIGYWNEIVGCENIVFVFKLPDGTIEELPFSQANRQRIAELCSTLNGDPITTTADVPRYLAGNAFYRELLGAFYDVPKT